ncbi:hypothetical protein ZORO111903_00230 [Zobellia roscoffensis]|uniref:hypothetical protein n=1 Tax=Zobellia roscoffensis TaxID=2779508 RepID=UPI00188C40F6|nr:hypothetical protein [Zobellia roscoffensis]
MSIFSYHLVKIPFSTAIKAICINPIPKNTKGLIHAEYMSSMTLGSAIVSTSRFLIQEVVVFAQWEDENALDDYLQEERFGRTLANGWHVRLSFMREWGRFKDFRIPEHKSELDGANSPVIAVTIARMKPLQIPRFLHWGRPVEKLVRDHPGTTLSLASFKFPNTVSTFSIWRTEKEMTDMVHGHNKVPKPKRHAVAMKERDRKSFHFEFTTLRFKPISESGSWKGQKNFVPNLKEN